MCLDGADEVFLQLKQLLEPFELSNFAPMAGEPMNDISVESGRWASGRHIHIEQTSAVEDKNQAFDTQNDLLFARWS